MRKRNVSAVNEADNSYEEYDRYMEEYYDYGGSGNVPDLGIAGSGGGVIGGFPQLPKLPTVPQQQMPNLELYNLRCPDGSIMKNGKCKSVVNTGTNGGANSVATNDEDGLNGGANGSGANGSGANGANGSGSGSGSANGSSGSGASGVNRKRKSKVKYWIPIVIIGALAIGYFSIKKVIK